jgi:hypothetical protein
MVSRMQTLFDPACRYGPGGDFTRIWPARMLPAMGGLRDLMGSMVELATAILGMELHTAVPVDRPAPACAAALAGSVFSMAGEGLRAVQPGPIARHRQLPQGQKLLFSDDSRIVTAARNKPGYRIRTYRKTSKKRHSVGLIPQESLFKTGCNRAKTA